MLHRVDISTLSFEGLIAREWLCANGVGGYASSTIPGLNSRKYHGLLVAALAPPVRRMVLLSRMEEVVRFDGWPVGISCNEYPGAIHPEGHRLLRAFSPEPFPRWAYQAEGWTLQKELSLLRGSNTVCITYTLLGGTRPIALEITPLFALRPVHDLMYQWNGRLAAEPRGRGEVHIPATSRTPEVFFAHDGTFEPQPNWYYNTVYRREQQRGYAGLEDLWTPGVIRQQLMPGQSLHFVCSTDPIDLARVVPDCDEQNARDAERAMCVPELVSAAMSGAGAQSRDLNFCMLRRSAEQFVVNVPPDGSQPPGIAIVPQYPWSAPSGRWALVALPGLLLSTERFTEAASLLERFAASRWQGLMPSEFPETGGRPVYDGADVSLWFIYALHAYFEATGDEALVGKLLPVALEIISEYRRGTELGIGLSEDKLLRAGKPGLRVTWMDAKVGDWVLTPRQGMPVELNALWYNALRSVESFARLFGLGDSADQMEAAAREVYEAFNRRFWNDAAECCYDVLTESGADSSVRPNQLLSVSLPYPVLSPSRQADVLRKVQQELLTPRGVRTLSPHDPDYGGRYTGHILPRDRAYHGGSAHVWLLGAYVSAYLRVHGRSDAALRHVREILQPCIDYLHSDGLGQLCELFDGDSPHLPGGAIASAAAVAEVLRGYMQTLGASLNAPGISPGRDDASAPLAPEAASTQKIDTPVAGSMAVQAEKS